MRHVSIMSRISAMIIDVRLRMTTAQSGKRFGCWLLPMQLPLMGLTLSMDEHEYYDNVLMCERERGIKDDCTLLEERD